MRYVGWYLFITCVVVPVLFWLKSRKRNTPDVSSDINMMGDETAWPRSPHRGWHSDYEPTGWPHDLEEPPEQLTPLY